MKDAISRRQFAKAAGGVTILGLAGCSEPSEEGEPPASPDEGAPEGPVEDQDGAAGQTPGRGPADGPGEENATADNGTSGGNETGETGGEGNESGDTGDEEAA